MPKVVGFHRVEFYNGSLDDKICTRDGLPFVPREGEAIALGPEIFKVCSVSYNLDYMGTDYEVWRANVILKREEQG